MLYSYLVSLGDWETDDLENNGIFLVWIIFFLNTLFNMVVMLNLLIAIISDVFSLVNSNAESAAYQEKARMILENSYLISMEKKN